MHHPTRLKAGLEMLCLSQFNQTSKRHYHIVFDKAKHFW